LNLDVGQLASLCRLGIAEWRSVNGTLN